MTTTKYDFPSVGCYVDESAGSADDCNRRTIEFAQEYGFEPTEYPEDLELDGGDYSQCLSELADKAIDYLNGLETRSYMSWGFEDNSLFLSVDVDSAREDMDNDGFLSSKGQEYPLSDYVGLWLHVSDHGNATLYERTSDGKDREIWSVV